MSTLTINNAAIQQNTIKTLNFQNDLCGSCWDIRVNVPSGETRTVVFSSNFQGSANYGISCNSSPNGNIINQDQSLTITETTDFAFGIDAAKNSGTNPYASNIYVEVLNFGVSLQSISYNRTHNNTKC